MFEVLATLPAYLLIIGFIYIFFLRGKIEEERNNLVFDNRVLGFVDALYLSGVKFGCSDFEMRSYVKSQLSNTHSLPGNKRFFEYTATNGMKYSSTTGLRGDHALFAILCIAQYASECNNTKLISWCESTMESARRISIHY